MFEVRSGSWRHGWLSTVERRKDNEDNSPTRHASPNFAGTKTCYVEVSSDSVALPASDSCHAGHFTAVYAVASSWRTHREPDDLGRFRVRGSLQDIAVVSLRAKRRWAWLTAEPWPCCPKAECLRRWVNGSKLTARACDRGVRTTRFWIYPSMLSSGIQQFWFNTGVPRVLYRFRARRYRQLAMVSVGANLVTHANAPVAAT